MRLEAIARIEAGAHWLRMYVSKLDSVNQDVVRRARDCGVKALVVTPSTEDRFLALSAHSQGHLECVLRVEIGISNSDTTGGSPHRRGRAI